MEQIEPWKGSVEVEIGLGMVRNRRAGVSRLTVEAVTRYVVWCAHHLVWLVCETGCDSSHIE